MFQKELTLAIEIAHQIGQEQLKSRQCFGQIIKKSDKSPVTEIDKKCENLIIQKVEKAFPNDGFLGEETGSRQGTNNRRWIIDPLDGTRPYIRQIPTYSVLLSLEVEGKNVLGVIGLPEMGIISWGCVGVGAYVNNKRVHVSNVNSLNDSMASSLGLIEKKDTIEGKKLLELMSSIDYSYGFMDAYSYVAVASGKLDFTVNLLDKPWDCAAGACIVEQAGGTFSDIKGNQSVHNGSIILSNGLLHNRILEYFTGI